MTCQISISVDVDTLQHYANFAPNSVVTTDPILSDTMPKLLELFDEENIKATFFVIGNTISSNKIFWQWIAATGHELASHSQTHVQAFHQLSPLQKQTEIYSSKQIIEDCIGQQVLGFRAPAYNIDIDLLKLLAEAGYQYDSSLFPGWFLPASKIVTRILSRTYQPVPTSSLHWQYRRLPKKPFYWILGSHKILEIPLPTTRFCKPFFGTVHLNFSPRFFTSEANWLSKRGYLIPYELHPIEVIDETVLAQAPWVRHIPGVGKYRNPWQFLRFRLQQLKQLGPIRLLREINPSDAQTVYSGSG